jgi:Sigma-54 interaction domain
MKAQTRFWRILRMVVRESLRARTMPRRSPLPTPLQVKLLHALQERQIRRVGAAGIDRKTDHRLINKYGIK